MLSELLNFLPLVMSLAVTAALIPMVRGAAFAAGKVTQVREDRWHQRPTPTLGGVGIFLGFGLTVLGIFVVGAEPQVLLESDRSGILRLTPWEALVAAGTLAFLVGVMDDFVQLPPIPKLVGQVAAASVLLMSGIGLWLTGIYTVDAILSLVWFVGITNALNLLDNMDGLAGGVALIAAGFLAFIFFMEGTPGLAMLSMALAGSLLGFLIYNYPPARIFMGDSGSLFLGMVLSGLALSPGPGLSRSLLAIMAVPALILAVPILDTTLVTVSRVLEGRSPAEGGQDHSSHRLVSLGMSEERAVWILWMLAAFGGAVGLLFRTTQRRFALLGGGFILAALALVGAYLLHVRFQRLKDEELRSAALYERLLRLHARYPILLFALDGLLLTLAYYGAYLIRWEGMELAPELVYFQRSLPVVLGVKLLVFGVLDIYGEDLRHFSLGEALRVVRANLVATVSVVAVLLMLQRTGLSRGVVAIDFLLATALTLAGRFSFRIMENWVRRWSRSGVAGVLLGSVENMGLTLAELEGERWPELRLVALADRRAPKKRGRFKGYPLFGGKDALELAMKHTDAEALILVEREGEGPEDAPGPGDADGGEAPEASMQLSVQLKIQVHPLRPGVTLKWPKAPPGSRNRRADG